MFLLQMGLAQREVDVLRQRTGDGMEAKLRAGGWANKAPEGYVNKEKLIKKGKYERWVEQDPNQIQMIRDAWDLLLTDRYTLVKAWQFRSGYRFKKVSEKKGQWEKPAKSEPLAMYVMKGAFAKSGKRRDRKGHETWTLESAAGKAEAEKMFTVIGMTHRDFEPLFSPVVYPTASDGGITTFAQAIFYNGNEQKPNGNGQKIWQQN